ncbi:DNA repair protein RecO [Acetobacter sp. AN02]|uniref:DNA repair protein RecO n=1 Tax=Acetobacter sp. AN02 TaxID=2894186 RepID=UPI00243415D8|nr:DNA repair protein RecO [Acetobacter sp. AN02]MDG6095347.1 DNA repair protein RecO [Acetobacter sp. AN02]
MADPFRDHCSDEGGASLEWEAPALVLSARLWGEADAIVHVLTEQRGLVHGLVYGGAGRRQAATWQVGNLVAARWRTRSEGQLGTLSGETVRMLSAPLLSSAVGLAMMTSVCAVADEAVPEHEPHPGLFADTLALLMRLSSDPAEAAKSGMAWLLRWEVVLLADLGFGLDFSCCAVTGETDDLKYVSPRTGRAVSESGAGVWRSRLLPLPRLFSDETDDGTPEDWAAGLRLTGHFMLRETFGQRHRPLPAARQRLEALVGAMCGSGEGG